MPLISSDDSYLYSVKMEATGPNNYDSTIRQCILEFFPRYDKGNTGFVHSSYFPDLMQNILTKMGEWRSMSNEQMNKWLQDADRNEDDKLTKMQLFCFLSNLMKKKSMGMDIYNLNNQSERGRSNNSGHSSNQSRSPSSHGQVPNIRKSVHNDYITSHSGQLLPVQYPQEEVTYSEPQTISQLIKTEPTQLDLYLKSVIDQLYERYDSQHRYYLTIDQLSAFLNECFAILKLPNRITPETVGFTFQYTDLNRDGVIQKMQVFVLLRELMNGAQLK